jgi:hypothetical protein
MKVKNCNNWPSGNKMFSRFCVGLVFFVTTGSPSKLCAQTPAEKDAAFRITLQQRSAKIVTALSLNKKKKAEKLTVIIANQYYNLNKVHDGYKEQAAATKTTTTDNETLNTSLQHSQSKKENELLVLHNKFVKKLSRKLTKEQVDKIKDGMTYNVMNVTYAAYVDMILSLTDIQKKKIYDWLREAREKAMDEGSSDDKHKVFGKYKGRINNYLSAEGYDMKAEEKKWQQRLREKRQGGAEAKQNQNA